MRTTEDDTKSLEELQHDFEQLAYGDRIALDLALLRLDLYMHRMFTSRREAYVALCKRITFFPAKRQPILRDKQMAWEAGKVISVNIVKTMIRELSEFGSSGIPVLVIHDAVLRSRCTEMLAAPGYYDTVIREATTILEARIKDRVPAADLTAAIPNPLDRAGEQLVNRLFDPGKPILVFGSRIEQANLCAMLRGTFAYLRNPSHHTIDDSVEWSWAWSVVGLIDQLLNNVDSCTYQKP